MTLRAQAAFSFLFATLCLAASPVQAQSALTENKTITSQDGENSPRLTIRVYRIAPLSNLVLAWAEVEAARMLRSAHLRLTWINCPAPTNSASCAIPEQPSDLILRVLATALPHAPPDALGTTAESAYGNCAFLFYNRVVACRTYRTLTFLVLGRAMAHEIVHLLLPSSGHSASGLMSAMWSPKDLQSGGQLGLGLAAQWVELIREEALRRCARRNPLDR